MPLRRALSCIIVDEAAIFHSSSFRFTLNLSRKQTNRSAFYVQLSIQTVLEITASQHGDIETLKPPTPCFVSIIWPSPRSGEGPKRQTFVRSLNADETPQCSPKATSPRRLDPKRGPTKYTVHRLRADASAMCT